MRVLLDENIDRLLKGLFAPEFEVMHKRLRSMQPGELGHVCDVYELMALGVRFRSN